jgi:hypothetical protein
MSPSEVPLDASYVASQGHPLITETGKAVSEAIGSETFRHRFWTFQSCQSGGGLIPGDIDSGGGIPTEDSGGAMLNRQAIMTRAWAIFREIYHYPQIKFARIGRPCFTACLRQAWAEAKATARIAGIPAETRSVRIVLLLSAIEAERFNDHWPSARANIAAMRAEILQLS